MVDRLLQCMGLTGSDDSRTFTRCYMARTGTVDKVQALLPELREFYLPCKAALYLDGDLTEHRVLTIARQLLRSQGRELAAKQTRGHRKKQTVYHILGCHVVASIETGRMLVDI